MQPPSCPYWQVVGPALLGIVISRGYRLGHKLVQLTNLYKLHSLASLGSTPIQGPLKMLQAVGRAFASGSINCVTCCLHSVDNWFTTLVRKRHLRITYRKDR